MRTDTHTIFRKIIILAFLLITALGMLFLVIAYFATTNFYQASTQKLNKDVAAHIATFTSPYDIGGIDRKKAAAVFHQAMVLSPSSEVYFLDRAGKIMAYDSTKAPIDVWEVPLEAVHLLIASKGNLYIKGLDPRDPESNKIFSASEVKKDGKLSGYIYVILGNSEYRSITNLVLKSNITILVIVTFIIIIILSLLISYYYLHRIRKRLRQMLLVIDRFQEGDLDARFSINDSGELAAITAAFNKMADLLVYQVDRAVRSEEERKNLTTNISHDLRTPLSIARGYTETLLLKRQEGTITVREQEEYIQLILAKILQVEHMVMQLFELSVMESAVFKPHKEPFVFSEVLNELVYTLRLKASEKNIEIVCLHCENECRIFADIQMMERMVQNLLVNAITYAPESSNVEVELEVNKSFLKLTIENKGIPLSDTLLTWLNAVQTGSRVYLQSNQPAIGLSIVKRILDIHDYSLSVAADYSGIIFRICMPFYNAESDVAI